MFEVATDLKITQPTITAVSNTFISIENYLSILSFNNDSIEIKTKGKNIRINGSKLSLKYIEDNEIGIKGIINYIEYFD